MRVLFLYVYFISYLDEKKLNASSVRVLESVEMKMLSLMEYMSHKLMFDSYRIKFKFYVHFDV